MSIRLIACCYYPFWGFLTSAVLGWYSTITVYVGIRGVFDIQHMLRTLKKNQETAETDDLRARRKAITTEHGSRGDKE